MYLPRHIEARLARLAAAFPVVLVTGARQVGKSTLVARLFGDGARTFVFDALGDLTGARQDPEFFLEQHPPRLILDEIQYAPELLPGIKRRVDRDRAPGQYVLTGSQSFGLMKQVAESLAGRVGIVDLEPMTARERRGAGGERTWLEDWLADPEAFTARPPDRAAKGDLFRSLWRGGFPGVIGLDDDLVQDWCSSYTRTYVERDVRAHADVRDLAQFRRFFALCAALTAQEVNRSQLGRDVDVVPQTAERWLSLLRATFLWNEVPPWSGNTVKRLSQRPKGYLGDTGLAAFLQVVTSPRALEASPALGALFETAVVHDVRRMASSLTARPAIHHWRTHAGAEVDLVLERDGELWPVEVKCSASPGRRHEAGLRAFRESYPHRKVRRGLLIAAVPEVRALSRETTVVPWDL
ncbi:ATP-binding protein [Myxococcota bacterium]|nr:ATP-binding protein [Myxococcota bacterium]